MQFMTIKACVLVHMSRRLKCTIVITRCPSSVVRPSVRPSSVVCRLSLTFHIFDFSSETTERNSTKLDRKQDLNVLYQVCVFPADRKKQDGRPGHWLAETFSTSHLKPLNGIQRNLTGSKISTSSTKFVFFGPIGKTRWPPWPLIGWDIFDFSSETTERNSRKLDRKQDLKRPLPSLCFWGRSEKQDGRPGLWLAETFLTSHLKPPNRIHRNLTGSKISTSSTKFVFLGPIKKTRWPPWPLIGWDIFDFSSETAERNSTKLDRKQDLNVLYQVVFSGRSVKQDGRPGLWLAETFSTSPLKTAERNSTKLDRKQDLSMSSTKFVFFFWGGGRSEKQDGHLASDWLRHFQLLLWNRWAQFNKTWQEARSQCPLPSLCFSGQSEKQYCRPGLWLAETFSTSPLKSLNGIQQNLTGSKISTSSTKFCFSVWWVNKNYHAGRFLKKVAHCTQVHDMWPFGPLVSKLYLVLPPLDLR